MKRARGTDIACERYRKNRGRKKSILTRTGRNDFGRAFGGIPLERFLKHPRELAHRRGVGSLVSPSLFGVEQLGGNAFERRGRREVEDAGLLELSSGESTVVDRVDDATGDLEGATLALTESAADPSGVDEPAVRALLGHASGEHRGVTGRVEDDERCAKARAENRRRLSDAVLSARSLGGVAREEPVLKEEKS
jgi:hypothetical protein